MLSALIIPLPELDPLVGRWRRAFDPAAAQGVGAHVTVLYPFLDVELINNDTLDILSSIFAPFPAFPLTLARSERLGAILALAPEPTGPFLALTDAVRARWPALRPYRGRYGDRPAPHLTVAWSRPTLASGAPDLDPIEAALQAGLPARAEAREVVLEVLVGARWTVAARFPLTSP